jgi:hypothetical protein
MIHISGAGGTADVDHDAHDRRLVPCVDGSVLARDFLNDVAMLVGAAMCSAFDAALFHGRWP